MQTIQPIPYQGSKRLLSSRILKEMRNICPNPRTLFEPFVGSGALTLAASQQHYAQHYALSDIWPPMMRLWDALLNDPAGLADRYAHVWEHQGTCPTDFYHQVREIINNNAYEAEHVIFLLARCVKNSPRFNQKGQFNQSPDQRRCGTHPDTMRTRILWAHAQLSGKTDTYTSDYAEILRRATPNDVIYLDPPYMGVSGRDKRYILGLDYDRFVGELRELQKRHIPFAVSFDGSCGDKQYGIGLPDDLGLRKISLPAGRSTQATLNRQNAITTESLYLSA
jgi:DNA adenine methylase